jgi:endonuclease/exonuclease/phosphatase family metal-dependent hydrolase
LPIVKDQTLRLLSFNIQVGIGAYRLRHYITHSWRHVLPHTKSLDNLDRIAYLVQDFDLVALQEVDAGSLRSSFVNQIEYLAMRGHFPYWCHQTNRKLGKFAQASNGLLSKYPFTEIQAYKLPGRIPGRGALMVHYGRPDKPLVLFILHLALSRRARMMQLGFLRDIVNTYEYVILMGDFNCHPHSSEMQSLLKQTNLSEPSAHLHTFPSWRPKRPIDHILVSPSIHVASLQALDCRLSDHLPIAMEVIIPADVSLKIA